MKESERYSLALITLLGGGGWGGGVGAAGFRELPEKNKQDFISESTSHQVPMWQLEATVRSELR